MTRQELITILNGSELYIKELHYSKLLNKYIEIEYPIIVENSKEIVDNIDWENKSIEDILILATDYLNSL
jgi:sulfur carrier protein ThiS